MATSKDETGVRLQGMKVTHAGDLTQMGLDRFKALVQVQGGTYQKSPQGVHLIVCGDDAGDKPTSAKQSNPHVLVWDESAFLQMIRSVRTSPIMLDPSYVRATTPKAPPKLPTPESYGDF